jgi:hypothetical protein
VKIIAEGERANMGAFVEEIDIRNFLIRVTDIERKDSEYIGEYENFYKLVGDGETDERLDTAAELLKELILVTKSGFENIGKKLEDLELITKNGFENTGKKLEDLELITKNGFENVGKKLEDLELITKNGFDKTDRR